MTDDNGARQVTAAMTACPDCGTVCGHPWHLPPDDYARVAALHDSVCGSPQESSPSMSQTAPVRALKGEGNDTDPGSKSWGSPAQTPSATAAKHSVASSTTAPAGGLSTGTPAGPPTSEPTPSTTRSAAPAGANSLTDDGRCPHRARPDDASRCVRPQGHSGSCLYGPAALCARPEQREALALPEQDGAGLVGVIEHALHDAYCGADLAFDPSHTPGAEFIAAAVLAAFPAALGARPEQREALPPDVLIGASARAAAMRDGVTDWHQVTRYYVHRGTFASEATDEAASPVQPVTDEATATAVRKFIEREDRTLPDDVKDLTEFGRGVYRTLRDLERALSAAVPVPVVTEPAVALMVGNVEVAAWLASDEALKIAAETDQARCPEQPCPMPRLHRDAARAILTALSTALSSEEYRTP